MKIFIKAISFALVLMLFATSAAFAATVPTDVSGTNWEKAVTTLVESGAITGDEDGLFHAENNLTRAQACIIIVKTINPPASMVNGTATQSATKTNFTDLKGYSWAAGYIGYAVKNGIVKGYPDGTFKPGNKVSTNEMLTMVLRAAGYTEEQIGANWPQDYITKAKAEGVLEGIEENYAEYATKGMAAQMAYNKMAVLKTKAPTVTEQPQGTDKDGVNLAPSVKGMTFAIGSFDSNITTFAGKSLAKDIKVYTYGLEKDYNKDMTFSNKAEAYRLDTVYKYKNVKTSVWYRVENGSITEMIVPGNVGYTGRACVVINKKVTTTNAEGKSVDALKTLTAGLEITWLTRESTDVPAITDGDGQVYELYLSNGEAKSVATTVGAKYSSFVELTPSNIDAVTNVVYSYKDGMVRIENATGTLIDVKDNATIYVWDKDEKEYVQGNLNSIREGKQIRAYDASDDDASSADLVVIK